MRIKHEQKPDLQPDFQSLDTELSSCSATESSPDTSKQYEKTAEKPWPDFENPTSKSMPKFDFSFSKSVHLSKHIRKLVNLQGAYTKVQIGSE